MKAESPSPTGATSPAGSPLGTRALRWLDQQAALLLLLTFILSTAGILGYVYYQSTNLHEALLRHGAAGEARTPEEFRKAYAVEVAERADAAAEEQAGFRRTLVLVTAVYGLELLGFGFIIRRLWQTTAQLQSTEARKRALMDTAAEGIFTLDDQGALESFNAAAGRTFGYRPGEVIGSKVFMLLPGPGGERLRAYLEGALQPGEPQVLSGEFEGQRQDGSRFPLHLAVSAVRVGSRLNFIGIVRDLSRRRQTEAALEHERFLLHTLMENLPDHIYFKDAESRFLRINRALSEWVQLSDPEQAVGKTDFDYFSEEHARHAFTDEQEMIRTGRPIVGVEEKETWPDGRQTWVSTTKMPLRDSEGRICGTFGISRDITARKLAEEALRESESRTRLIIDTAYDAFVGMDAAGTIVAWNAQAELTFGWSRAEALGRVLADTIIPAEYRAQHTQGLQHFLATGEGPVLHQRIEISALRRDGQEFPVELTIAPIQWNQTYFFSAFIRDITRRKKAQAELQQAKEAAEAASRAKSEFLANVSHEIRTPMNGILGMTELALDTDLAPEQRDYLNLVKASADSLLTVINDILDFSKIEAGKLDLDQTEFLLRDSLGDTLKTLAQRAHNKGLELACHIAPDVPDALIGDPDRLRQIIVNLAGNAIKFTEAGEVVVDVEALPDDAGPQATTLHLAVRDTGIGIPAHKQQAIFNAFEQVDSSTTRRYGGTGLGLTISSRLVGLMGGRLWVESEMGQGSTFHFTARFQVQPEPAARPGPNLPRDLQELPVLVVDDNATNRRILDEMLTNWHMKPTVVESAPAALRELDRARLAGRPFALVLLDSHMPDMDGFALAQRIKQHPELASLTLMMLTSGGQPGDVARCRELGIGAYLMKPIKQSDLFDRIITLLGTSIRKEEPAVSRSTEGLARPLRVLLAEDNIVNQTLVVRLLEKRGHHVVVTSDGRQALAALGMSDNGRGIHATGAAPPFDVVLMDVQMPDMGGFETTAAIRQREKSTGGHLLIIAMTAHAMKGDRERCLEAGMDGYISKPVQARELYETMEKLVGPSAASAPRGVQAASTASADIDWDTALSQVAGDRELLSELIELFLDACPTWIADMHQAIAAGNAEDLQRLAHTIKGSSGQFGARQAQAAAQHLEALGKSGDLAHAVEACAALERELERARPLLAGFAKT